MGWYQSHVIFLRKLRSKLAFPVTHIGRCLSVPGTSPLAQYQPIAESTDLRLLTKQSTIPGNFIGCFLQTVPYYLVFAVPCRKKVSTGLICHPESNPAIAFPSPRLANNFSIMAATTTEPVDNIFGDIDSDDDDLEIFLSAGDDDSSADSGSSKGSLDNRVAQAAYNCRWLVDHEQLTDTRIGPKSIPDGSTEVCIFSKFFSDFIFDTMAAQINLYARQYFEYVPLAVSRPLPGTSTPLRLSGRHFPAQSHKNTFRKTGKT